MSFENPLSVSPIEEVDEELGEAEGESEEEWGAEIDGEVGDRLSLSREEDVLKRLVDPKLPTKKEMEDHRLMGHVVYRNWCPICVKAMGRDMRHFREKEQEKQVPEYSWDFCFLGDELGMKWTVLVGAERLSGVTMAVTLPEKS